MSVGKEETGYSFLAILNSIAGVFGLKVAIVDGDRRITWQQLVNDVFSLGQTLVDFSYGVKKNRSELENYQSGQDHLAICMQNSAEFLSVYLGACAARMAPLNVNYKYSADELRYLLQDSLTRVLVYDEVFAPTIKVALEGLENPPKLIEHKRTNSTTILLDGAISLSECFVNSSTNIGALVAASSPDDIVLQYTGGTTGMPKGVIWRQDDLFVRALGGRNFRDGGRQWGSINELISSVETKPGPRLMPVCPFMHGTGLWTALQSLFAGGTVVMPLDTTRFDSHLVLEAIEAEKVVVLVLVGDAFFRPLIDELMKSDYKLESLRFIISSGAAISATNREAVAKRLPHVKVKNVVGSSESGPQAEESETKDFSPRPGTAILAEDRLSVLSASEEQSGWLASYGHIPLGYLNDPAKSAAIFPVIDGQRYSVPGDRVQPLGGGRFRLLGRDSMVINTGGEKVFVEEVEEAIKAHPDVLDVLVVSRPSERWGSEIVAVVSCTGNTPSPKDLLEVASSRIARYKLPKDFVFVDKVFRSPAGKGDYRWAKSVVASEGGQK